jgi:antitoxin YefM
MTVEWHRVQKIAAFADCAIMATEMTLPAARANLAKLLERVADGQETVIIKRQGAEDVALVSAAELSSLLESIHLLRSPANARRLLAALSRATVPGQKPHGVSTSCQEIGLKSKKPGRLQGVGQRLR